MANAGANALVVIRNDLPGTLAELTAERDKLVERIRDLNEQIVEAETHVAVARKISPEPKEKA